MSVASKVAQKLAQIPTVRSETCVFVRMDGTYAVVNVGSNTIRVPVVGWVPPVSRMTVQLEWRNGRPVLMGPARALSPFGEITATGTPQATVTVDGVEYMLYLRDGYSPTVGDQVTVNWQTGIIEGKITGSEEPVPPPTTAPAPPAAFSGLVVRAADSGRFQSSWWGKGPWASSSNNGIWTYLQRNRDALRGANVHTVEIYLPLEQQIGNANITLHPHPGIPGGAPILTDPHPLPIGGRSGWVRLPDWWGNWLRDNAGGIGVTAPGGAGFTKWLGVDRDGLSGALRFSGVR